MFINEVVFFLFSITRSRMEITCKKSGQAFFKHGIIFSIHFFFASSVVASYDTTLISRICNGKIYSAFDNNYLIPDLVVEEVVAKTPSGVGLLVPVKSTFPSPFAGMGVLFGMGYCSGSISKEDCADCMQSARNELNEECSRHGAGAQIHLRDCEIRYEEYPINDVK